MVVLDNFDQFNQCVSEGEDSSSSSHHIPQVPPWQWSTCYLFALTYNVKKIVKCQIELLTNNTTTECRLSVLEFLFVCISSTCELPEGRACVPFTSVSIVQSSR